MSYKKHKWNEKDEVDLLKYINENKSMEYIIKKFKIDEKTIIYKLKKMASKMTTKKTKDEIFNSLKFLKMEQIEKIIEKKNYLVNNNLPNNNLINNNDITKKIDVIYNKISVIYDLMNKNTNQNNNSSFSDKKIIIETIKNDNNENKNNNISTSITANSSEATDKIINLIKNKTQSINERRQKLQKEHTKK
jgi:hypothetical protein